MEDPEQDENRRAERSEPPSQCMELCAVCLEPLLEEERVDDESRGRVHARCSCQD